jgi:hypothetical protein
LGGYGFFSKKNSLIPNFAEKNILILVEKTNFALCATKKKYSNSCVVRKKDSERKKTPHNPPLQVKWSVPHH